MATFKFGRAIDLHWNGYDIQGPAETVFSIPDQLYEEFDVDIAPVEPTLVWIDTNEFLTLQNSLPSGAYVKAAIGTSPISVSTSSNTATISLNSGTASNGYLLAANGSGGTIWTPASTSSLTSVIGVSPISTIISGGTVSVSLTANYQTSGTYVTTVGGTSPISASGTTAITVSIDSSILTAENAARIRTYVRNTTASTITKGSVVYLDGSNGTVPSIKNALANADATSSRTFGIVEADIPTNSNGYVTNQGLLSPLDTSTVADGAVLWLSPTVAGAFTTTKPAGPNHGVLVGIVVKGTSVGAGSIYVLIKNGSELDEIHDVNITSPVTGQSIIWSSTASVWQNALIGSASISASAITSGHISSGAVGSAAIATGSINSTHLSATSVGSTQLIAQSVTTAKIGSGAAASATVLTADGSGGAVFSAAASGFSLISSATISSGVSTVAKPSNAKIAYLRLVSGGGGGGAGRSIDSTTVTARGGYGGGRLIGWVSASSLSSIVSYSIGAGGSGVTGGSFTSATITAQASTNGTAGGDTTFGPFTAYADNTLYYQNPYFPNESAPGTTTVAGYSGLHSGGGGTASSSQTSNSTSTSGGASSHSDGINLSRVLIAAGGGGAAGTSNSSNGGTATSGSDGASPGYGGGAGGSKRLAGTATVNSTSGNGGNGAYPGGGGGSSGVVGVTAAFLSTFTVTQGNAGNGAGGQIYVEWYG